VDRAHRFCAGHASTSSNTARPLGEQSRVRDDFGVGRRFAVGMAGVALGIWSLLIARDDSAVSFVGSSWSREAMFLTAGLGLLAAGVAFWVQRPGNKVAGLLVAASAGWFLSEWDSPAVGSAPIFTVGLVLAFACPPLIAWVMLAYPTGRLKGWADCVAVFALLASGVLVVGALANLFYDPAGEGCAQCSRNLILVSGDPERVADVAGIGLRLVTVSALLVLVVAAWRLARASATRRRVVAPIAFAGGVYLACVAWSAWMGAARGFVGTGSLERRLWLAQAACLVVLAGAVGWSCVRARRTRASLAGLVVELGETARPGGLRDSLANLLGEPDLVLAYPLGDGGHVDAAGRPVNTATGDRRATTPLVRDGMTVAVLIHRHGLLDDPDLVDNVASAARLGLENERLQAGLRAQERDVRASRARIVTAADSERRRLEQDLHDGAQQRLIATLLGVRVVQASLDSDADDATRGDIEEVAVQLQRAVDELRVVAHGIYPAVLTDEGLAAALESLAEAAAHPVEIVDVTDERYPAAVENAAYRVVAEAAKKGATRVAATRRDDRLVIDVAATAPPKELVELEDRVGALNGRIRVEEGPSGVTLRAEFPCA
jgi:signal transduction histidine kinase